VALPVSAINYSLILSAAGLNKHRANKHDRKEWSRMLFQRRFRDIYLRFASLRGQPHELALGIAFGIFVGMVPIVPFHTIIAVSLALAFKASKITAAAGVWICNPATIYHIYKYCHRIGSFILGIEQDIEFLAPVVEAINDGRLLYAVNHILGAGGVVVTIFLLGGIVLGIVFATPSYFIFLYLFRSTFSWRKSRRRSKG